jgi:hypothetical protein
VISVMGGKSSWRIVTRSVKFIHKEKLSVDESLLQGVHRTRNSTKC